MISKAKLNGGIIAGPRRFVWREAYGAMTLVAVEVSTRQCRLKCEAAMLKWVRPVAASFRARTCVVA
jgi:hypothetical protein